MMATTSARFLPLGMLPVKQNVLPASGPVASCTSITSMHSTRRLIHGSNCLRPPTIFEADKLPTPSIEAKSAYESVLAIMTRALMLSNVLYCFATAFDVVRPKPSIPRPDKNTSSGISFLSMMAMTTL